MPTETQCNDRRTDCRRGIYKAINERVSRWAFALVLGLVTTIMGSILGYCIWRGNGKASDEDLEAVRATVAETREDASEMRATQRMVLQGQEEMRADLKTILDRLPK